MISYIFIALRCDALVRVLHGAVLCISKNTKKVRSTLVSTIENSKQPVAHNGHTTEIADLWRSLVSCSFINAYNLIET